MFDIVVSAGAAAKELLIVCAGAGIIIGVLNLTGLAFNLTMHIVAAAGGSLILLAIITGLISIVLGMGMPTVGVYILLATLVVPALVAEGISLMAAHLFVFYFGLMSMITPPVALAAFAAANIAGASAWQTSWTSIRLGWTAYIVPFLFLFAPALLLQGNPFVVTFAVVTAILGIYATTAGMVGFTRGACGPLRRLILIVSGLAILVPTDLFEGGLILNLVGLAVVLPAILIRTAQGESLKLPVTEAAWAVEHEQAALLSQAVYPITKLPSAAGLKEIKALPWVIDEFFRLGLRACAYHEHRALSPPAETLPPGCLVSQTLLFGRLLAH